VRGPQAIGPPAVNPGVLRLLAVPLALLTSAVAAAPAAAHLVTHRDTRSDLAVTVAATAAAADLPGALPYRWCGDELTRDDSVHAALPPDTPQFKFVYAHPADRPDNFGAWSQALQANVALVQRFLAAQTGGAKALRIDMGTRCGPQYVDVQAVHLQGPRARYVDNFGAIVREVRSHLRGTGPRNLVVLADTLNGTAHDYGLGEAVLGETGARPGAANPHNRGGFASMLFSRDVGLPATDARGAWWPEGLLHEITHNLGAVQWSAPHSTQPPGMQDARYGHCWQGADVMCYLEDAGAAHPMRFDCPRVDGAIPQAYDCGRDDYFNPAPAPGSYLATHWNVYDSAFLGSCAELAPACGGGMDGLVPSPPVSTGPPAVAGLPRRGAAVAVEPGQWRNGPLSYSYRWQRERRGVWLDIPGATGSSYVPARADTGRHLRVQVVATNPDGSAVAASAATEPVTDGGVGRAARSKSSCRKAKRATARARRRAARCRGRRASKRASARHGSPRRRSSGAVRGRPGAR
jgi:hypothetical protein